MVISSIAYNSIGFKLMYFCTMQAIAEESAKRPDSVTKCFTHMRLQNGPQLKDLLTALESPVIHRADIAEDLKGKIACK